MATQLAVWVGLPNRAQGLVDGAAGFHEYGGALYLACQDDRSYPPEEGIYMRLAVYRSTDNGLSWTRLTPSRLFGPGGTVYASGWAGPNLYVLITEGPDWYQVQLWRYSIASDSWDLLSTASLYSMPVYDGIPPDPVPFYTVYGLSNPGRIVEMPDGKLRILLPVVLFG